MIASDDVDRPAVRPAPWGSALAGAGALVDLVGWFVGSPFLRITALVIVLSGSIAACAGTSWARRLAFPIVFLLFAAPLPPRLDQPLALALQAWVCGLSTWALELAGVAVFRVGSVLELAGHALDVGAACAGVRQATAYLALTLAVGHLSGRAWGYRLGLAALALPVALAANVARVLLTAGIVLTAGPAWARGMWHDLEGATLVLLGAGFVLLAAQGLTRVRARAFGPRRCAGADREGAPGPSCRGRLLTVVLVALATKGLLALHLRGTADAEPLRVPVALSDFPVTLGAWRGTDLPVAESSNAMDQRVRRRYENVRTGAWAVVALDASSTGRDRDHHPVVCMATAGLREDATGRTAVALGGDGAPAQRFRFVGPDGGQAFFYWHYTFQTASAEPDALRRAYRRFQVRPPSLTVEVCAAEPAAGDDAELRSFVARLDAALAPHLPSGAVRGRERRPVFLVNGPFAGVWN